MQESIEQLPAKFVQVAISLQKSDLAKVCPNCADFVNENSASKLVDFEDEENKDIELIAFYETSERNYRMNYFEMDKRILNQFIRWTKKYVGAGIQVGSK